MEQQRVLNVGFVMEHEKLRWNTNSFWGLETVIKPKDSPKRLGEVRRVAGWGVGVELETG